MLPKSSLICFTAVFTFHSVWGIIRPIERKVVNFFYPPFGKLHVYSNCEICTPHIHGKIEMIKHEYNVLEAFTLYTDELGKRSLESKKGEKQSGSTFAVQSSYVDYEFPYRNIALAAITKELIKKKYIRLARSIKRGRDRQE